MTAKQCASTMTIAMKSQTHFAHLFSVFVCFALRSLYINCYVHCTHIEIQYFIFDSWSHLYYGCVDRNSCISALGGFVFRWMRHILLILIECNQRTWSFGDSDVQLFIDKVFLSELSHLYFTPRCSHSKSYECGISFHIAEFELKFSKKFSQSTFRCKWHRSVAWERKRDNAPKDKNQTTDGMIEIAWIDEQKNKVNRNAQTR